MRNADIVLCGDVRYRTNGARPTTAVIGVKAAILAVEERL